MKYIKDFLILTVGQLFQVIIMFISVRIITSLLSPIQMGRFSIIYTIAALFFSLFVVPVGNYLQRKIIEWNLEGRVHYYTRQYIYYLFLAGIFAVIIILILKNFINIVIDISNLWISIIIFSLIFLTYVNAFFYNSLNIFKKRLWFTLCSNLTLLLGLISSIFLVLLFSKTAEHWISGQILGQILTIFISSILFFKIINKPSKKETYKYPSHISLASDLFRFAWPISITSIVVWLQTQSYRFLLRGISGIEVLGFFIVGFNLSIQLIGQFEFLFCNFYDPIFYNEIANSDNQKKAEAWNKYAKAFFPAIILVSLFICAGSKFIAKIFVAPNFQRISTETMVWGGVTALLLSSVSNYKIIGIAKLEMKSLLFPYVLGTFVALAGITILCRWNPYTGAGLSLSLGAFSTLVYLMVKMHKVLPVNFPKARVILSIIYSLPMIIVFFIFRKIMPYPRISQSILVLTILGSYQLFAQFILAKDWILRSKVSFIKTVNKKNNMKIFH